MRTRTIWNAVLALVVTLAASPAPARTLDGTVKLGQNFLDEEGDLSTVQETYNVYEGFALAQVSLNGTLDARRYFMLDLRDLNLDSRRGDFLYRAPGFYRINAGYDRHRQVFTPNRGTTSSRQDWNVGAEVSPSRWLDLTGSFNYLTRDGDRVSFPAGTADALGVEYDNVLRTGQVSADVHSGRRGAAISFNASDYRDKLQATGDRRGQVVAGRLWAPSPFYDRWTNFVRGAYGIRRLTTGGIEHQLYDVQYTAVVQPVDAYELRYAFQGRRVDDRSTDLETDLFTNDIDAVYRHARGQLSAGYGYEMNDDDHSLTQTHHLRGGVVLRDRHFNAKLDYAGRTKRDEQKLTLLQDVEAYRVRGRLELKLHPRVIAGGGYTERDREFPDIDVETMGQAWNAYTRVTVPGWCTVSADYSLSTDTYTNRAAGFYTRSHIVTGRAELERIKNVLLAGGVTYLQIGRDLDIEKSIVFLEGSYTLLKDYHVEVKYNAYNYDDYVLLDRYYTANVVQVRLARDLHLKD